ncbi:RepB family plasmid replication initiator protein [Hymenobacter sp. HMF4947]|uniref:RepB family plasmid replication initiator protein n=1 Tax=Hymenobacter ginkgonis TaxID=2682976 RepID=A0A7K1TM71_9BACT|nr:RepB family plasmid replication initiator protein [Hymenobacter ginkgonis]MVN79221.1 RepB family plasmid replication initiator protein [Hymenobacter ginkgonis]
MQNELSKPLSSYKGVCYDKLKGRWKARVLINGKRVSVGYHDTAEQAYEAVQQAQHQAALPTVKFMVTPAPDNPPVATVSAEQLPIPDNYQEIVARARRTTTVVQHNTLVETPTTTTLLEARIFCLMLRTIRKGDTEVPTAVIPLEELFPTFGGHQHQLLEAAMLRMMSATLRIPEPNEEDVHLVSLCDSMRYDSATKMLIATFGKAVTPYLVNLAGNFALADVDELLAIKSNSSQRLYWLMRAWQFKSPHTISVEQLKELTAASDHYKEYSDFRRKVLKPSVAELNELSFDITYTERRQRGRAVTDITFNINRKSKLEQLALPLNTAAIEIVSVPQLTPLQQKVQTRLQKLKLTQAQIKKVLEVVVGEEQLTKLLKETYPVLRDFETKAKPGENVAAATMALLKSTFPAIWAAN